MQCLHEYYGAAPLTVLTAPYATGGSVHEPVHCNSVGFLSSCYFA